MKVKCTNNNNSQSKLFEFYLFVNPLGRKCYYAEIETLKAIQSLTDEKVELNYVLFHNQKALSLFMNQLEMLTPDLEIRNLLFKKTYLAALAYKAASLQGKFLARQFLQRIQASAKESIWNFSEQLLDEIADWVGLDVDQFHQDIQSAFVKNLYVKDQKIARDMSIEQSPSLIIYECCQAKHGYLLEGEIQAQDILDVIHQLNIDGQNNQFQGPNTLFPTCEFETYQQTKR